MKSDVTLLSDTAPFFFETSFDSAGERPERRASPRSKLGVTEDRLFVAFGVVGIACLFWRYTIALGAVTLALSTFAWAMRERSRTLRKDYAPLREPSRTVRMTLTQDGYSLSGDDFSAETKWSNVFNGFETDGSLLIQAWRMPRVYIKIDELKQAGVYERVREIVDAKRTARKAALAAISASTASAKSVSD